MSHDRREPTPTGRAPIPTSPPTAGPWRSSSEATNLVEGDHNGTADVFRADTATGVVGAVTGGDGPSGQPSISDDGRYVALSSGADDLVPGDTNGPDPRGLTPANFFALDRAGRPTYASSIVEIDGPRVRVGFPVDVSAASGAAVEGGTLTDAQTLPLAPPDGRLNTNPPAAVPLSPPNGPAPADPNGIIDGPDLLSAEAVADDNGTPSDTSDDAPTVRYCFDTPLAPLPGTGDGATGNRVETTAFTIAGYNSAARRTSIRARPADGDPGCVLAAFPVGVDPARFTLALAGAERWPTPPDGPTSARPARCGAGASPPDRATPRADLLRSVAPRTPLPTRPASPSMPSP